MPKKNLNPLERAPRLTVKVTQENIVESMGRDSSHCMIAEAVRQAHPDASFVSVDTQTIRFSVRGAGHDGEGRRYTYLTPRIAQLAIVDFDQGNGPDEPFQFQLQGGQVTAMGRGSAYKGRAASSEGQQAAQRKAVQVMNDGRPKKGSAPLSTGTLVDNEGGGNNVPSRVGGRTPPLGGKKNKDGEVTHVPFARRRAFGLRALGR